MATCNCAEEYAGFIDGCALPAGGIVGAWAMSRCNLTNVTITDCAIDDYDLADGACFQRYSIRKSSSSMETTGSQGSGLYTTTLNLVFQYLTAEKNCELQKFDAGDAIWLIKDRNGLHWLVGVTDNDDEDGMERGDFTDTTGTAADDENGYTMAFVYETNHRPYFVDAATASALKCTTTATVASLSSATVESNLQTTKKTTEKVVKD